MAARANLTVDQGSTFSVDVNLTDDNGDALLVTGYTAAAQLRKSYTTSNSVSFTTSLANGSLTLSLSANQTSNIISGRYVYDCEMVKDGLVTRIIEGIVTIRPEVTR